MRVQSATHIPIGSTPITTITANSAQNILGSFNCTPLPRAISFTFTNKTVPSYSPVAFEPGEFIFYAKSLFGNQSITIEYDPNIVTSPPDEINPLKTPREKIKLEGIPEETITLAKQYAEKIAELSRKSNQEEKYITIENFLEYGNKVKEEFGYPDLNKNPELLVMTAYTCRMNETFAQMPSGMILGAEIPDTITRLGALCRFYLVNCKGINTAKKLEDFSGYQTDLSKYHLSSFMRLSLSNMTNLAFPGYTEGENPIIRPWLLQDSYKWSGEASDRKLIERRILATRAARHFLKFDADAVDQFNAYRRDVISKITQDRIFASELSGFTSCYPEASNQIGLYSLACPELFGLEENQIRPWGLHHGTGKWSDDDVFDALAESVARKNMYTEGKFDIEKARSLTTWSLHLTDEAGSKHFSDDRSYIFYYTHRYPNLVGLGENQIRPWNIRHNGMREGQYGIDLSRAQLLFEFSQAGLGKLEINGDDLKYTLTKEQFAEWNKNTKKIKEDVIKKRGLASLLLHFANGSIVKLFEFMLGTSFSSPGRLTAAINALENGKTFTVELQLPRKNFQETTPTNQLIKELIEPFNAPVQEHHATLDLVQEISSLSKIEDLEILHKCLDIYSSQRNSTNPLFDILNHKNANGEFTFTENEIEKLLRIFIKNLKYGGYKNEEDQNKYKHLLYSIIHADRTKREILLDASSKSGRGLISPTSIISNQLKLFMGLAAIRGAYHKEKSGEDILIRESNILTTTSARIAVNSDIAETTKLVKSTINLLIEEYQNRWIGGLETEKDTWTQKYIDSKLKDKNAKLRSIFLEAFIPIKRDHNNELIDDLKFSEVPENLTNAILDSNGIYDADTRRRTHYETNRLFDESDERFKINPFASIYPQAVSNLWKSLA